MPILPLQQLLSMLLRRKQARPLEPPQIRTFIIHRRGHIARLRQGLNVRVPEAFAPAQILADEEEDGRLLGADNIHERRGKMESMRREQDLRVVGLRGGSTALLSGVVVRHGGGYGRLDDGRVGGEDAIRAVGLDLEVDAAALILGYLDAGVEMTTLAGDPVH